MRRQLSKDEITVVQSVINANLRRWRTMGSQELEDMASMAWVTVLERLPRHNPERASLRTFADLAVKSAFMDWYRKYYKPRNVSKEDAVASFNNHVADDSLLRANADKLSAEERLDLYNAIAGLDGRDADMIGYYLEGMLLKEIGRLFGISESRVSQLFSAIIDKLKEARLANLTEAEDSKGEILAAYREEPRAHTR